ncbi:MAG: T9SS type A sorting domain-containing protein [Flavobacterium sp.]|nr:T9SS type A sorting domain-containing protein [Flavobacterium sp.]
MRLLLLSAKNFDNFDFQLYPNPVTSALSIRTQLENFAYTIYTIEGKVVQNGKSTLGTTTINVSKLPAGMYLIDILSEAKERSIQKFIKN